MRVDGNFIDELLLRELARKITMQNRSTGGRSAAFRSVNNGGLVWVFLRPVESRLSMEIIEKLLPSRTKCSLRAVVERTRKKNPQNRSTGGRSAAIR